MSAIITDQDLQTFVSLLNRTSNYDFSEYSERSIKRRIQKVMSDFRLDFSGLLEAIKSDSGFIEQLVIRLTVNTTELFRDPTMWHMMRSHILPRFKSNRTINIWHAGCSTGQEVYSMMILLSEMDMLDRAKIFATDLSSEVLDVARKGEYRFRFNINYLDNFDRVIKHNPLNYDGFKEVPYEKYFTIDRVKDTITMNREFTKKPVFRKHDLVKGDSQFYAKFDIILCRNVIIYFNHSLQNKVFNLFHNHLFDDGVLVLGMHETILGPWATRFERMGQAYIKKQ